MTQSLLQSALHWAATLQTEDWTYQIYDTVLAPVSPPSGGHLTDWGLKLPDLWCSPCPSRPSIGRPPYRLRIEPTRSMMQSLPQSALHWAATLQTEDWNYQIYDTVLAPVSPPSGGHLTDWGLKLPDLWCSPCPSRPSIGRPPYRLRIEPTRSMMQSLPQSALHWAATLQTEDWTYQIYDAVLAPVGPPLGSHLTDWGLNLPDLWCSPCPSQPSIGQPPYRLRIEPTRSMMQSLPQSALHWVATLQTEDWTYQIYDTVLAPVGPPLGGHLTDWGLNLPDLWGSPCPSQPSTGWPLYILRNELTRSMRQSLPPQLTLHWAATLQTEDWTYQIYGAVLAPVGPPLGGHLTYWGLNSQDLWCSPCPSQPSTGRPPYRLRNELTRSMRQSLPQSALHWVATLHTEEWTHKIYEAVLAPVSPPLGGHFTYWGMNSQDLWGSPCPRRPSIEWPPYILRIELTRSMMQSFPFPSRPSIGRPPYRLRIEPTRSMTQSFPQSALHWAATLQTCMTASGSSAFTWKMGALTTRATSVQ